MGLEGSRFRSSWAIRRPLTLQCRVKRLPWVHVKGQVGCNVLFVPEGLSLGWSLQFIPEGPLPRTSCTIVRWGRLRMAGQKALPASAQPRPQPRALTLTSRCCATYDMVKGTQVCSMVCTAWSTDAHPSRG